MTFRRIASFKEGLKYKLCRATRRLPCFEKLNAEERREEEQAREDAERQAEHERQIALEYERQEQESEIPEDYESD